MEQERRKYKRYSVFRNIKMQKSGEKRLKSIVVKEASQAGLRVNHEEFIAPKSVIKIVMNPDIYEEITGRVIWTRKVPYQDVYESGLEFVDVDSYLRKQIILELLSWRS